MWLSVCASKEANVSAIARCECVRAKYFVEGGVLLHEKFHHSVVRRFSFFLLALLLFMCDCTMSLCDSNTFSANTLFTGFRCILISMDFRGFFCLNLILFFQLKSQTTISFHAPRGAESYLWVFKAKSFSKFFAIRFADIFLHLKTFFQSFSLWICAGRVKKQLNWDF